MMIRIKPPSALTRIRDQIGNTVRIDNRRIMHHEVGDELDLLLGVSVRKGDTERRAGSHKDLLPLRLIHLSIQILNPMRFNPDCTQ